MYVNSGYCGAYGHTFKNSRLERLKVASRWVHYYHVSLRLAFNALGKFPGCINAKRTTTGIFFLQALFKVSHYGELITPGIRLVKQKYYFLSIESITYEFTQYSSHSQFRSMPDNEHSTKN